MRVDIAWWDLAGTPQTIDSLREHLHGGAVRPWASVPGLRLKVWMADREQNRWGAVMLWQDDRPAGLPLPPNLAAELIGGPPTVRSRFAAQAAVEGRHTLPGLGPASTR